ncbi:MAG: hypothetical protein GY705_20935 [Bacteroidetes bacterium]|nr:hypothetical protein [Bacteroidota bacterium]
MRYTISIFILLFSLPLSAQMMIGADTLYGNEWINYEQRYFKIKITEDGMYRLKYQALQNAGVFAQSTLPEGSYFQVFHNGNEVPIYVSTKNAFQETDFIEFYGIKNRGEIDRFLYEDSTYQLNPLYSLFSDTATYFLTWNNTGDHLRFSNTMNDLSNPPEKETHCRVQKVWEYHNRHSNGKRYAGADVHAKYDIAEGYCRSTYNSNQQINLASTKFYSEGEDALLDVRLMTEDKEHQISIDFNTNNYVLDSFSNWAVRHYSFPIPAEELTNTNQLIIKGNASEDDKFRVSNIILEYPAIFNFSNENYFEFSLPGNSQRQYLEISNFNSEGQEAILFDLTNNMRLVAEQSESKIIAVLPPATGDRQLSLINSNAFKIPAAISTTDFIDFSNKEGNYIILSNSKLFDDGNGNNYVQDYADYRSTELGGGYDAVAVDVLQIFDQFGYGISRHEQAIRNFVHWSVRNWESEFLFIIGKGVIYRAMRTDAANWEQYDFVPTFGYPTSDNLLSADNFNNLPKIPVGRIAAYTPDMVRQYLEKVKAVESATQNAPQTIEDRAWMKNVLHLGGGDPNIQDFIRNRLEDMKDTISSVQYGANVFSLYKNSTDVIQSATSKDVVSFINEGVGLLTFFGHSAPNTLDFDIGDPSQYQNFGKYPLIYAMGCNTNRLFETRSTLSEAYVFVEDRGAIGFLGSTATTSLSNLNIYGKLLYQKLASQLYGEPIGKVMQSVIQDYPISGYWGELVQNNILLHGDPAIRLFPQNGPDYLVDGSKTKISPAFVNIQADSFLLDLTITNIGYAIQDSMDIQIEQEFPNGTKEVIKEVRIACPYYETDFQIYLPVLSKGNLGENVLHISIDATDLISELPGSAEMNNSYSLKYIVVSNSAVPVYPKEFSIVNEENLKLIASTANAFSDDLSYYFEIDTSANFDSFFKRSSKVNTKGGLIEWNPDIPILDSTVYFWRVSVDSSLTEGNGFDWRESSFIFIEHSNQGWNQSEHDQYIAKESKTLFRQEEDTKNFYFDTTSMEIKIITSSFFNLWTTEVALYENGFVQFTGYPCPDDVFEQMIVAIYNPLYLKRQLNPFNDHNSPNCRSVDIFRFIFQIRNQEDRFILMSLLEQASEGSYVTMFTTQKRQNDYGAHLWAMDSIDYGDNLFQMLEEQGATKIRNLAEHQTPYVLVYQKGNPSFEGFREVHAEDVDDILNVITYLKGLKSHGSLTSPPIGPSLSWNSLHWKVSDREERDEVSVDVFGITAEEEEVLLHESISAYDTTLAHIDANVYPYLKLRWNSQDTVNRTTPQLDYWRVLYDPYPEAALAPNYHFDFHKDTLQQGEPLHFEIQVQNVSASNMDSLLVQFTVKDAKNREFMEQKRYKPLPAGDSLILSFDFDTRELAGNAQAIVEVNPNDDQPELHHFNNIGAKEFYVETDKRNPLLDVTFDGTRIMNGDLVSARPHIIVTLEDENKFLELSDSSLFTLYLQYPDESTLHKITPDSSFVQFFPAKVDDLGEKNKATIELDPTFILDGTYHLIVKAVDASGNDAGKVDYKVAFEVITKQMVSHILNYPNPFSTSTRFVYTLTGSEAPAYFSIQILTVSGRVVRELTQEDLGPLKIGTHKTDYTWDGTDEFGDALANGVYLYRILAKDEEGKDIDLLETSTNQQLDSYFKGGFGKLVILR